MSDPFLYRLPSWAITVALFAGMVALWEFSFRAGLRGAPPVGEKTHELGPIEAAIGGLLALILAFSFSMASERFDLREDVIVREANAIGTAYLRCSFLTAGEQAGCRRALSAYAAQRVAFYEVGYDKAALADVSRRTQRLQTEIWSGVERSARERDTPALALTIGNLNELFDLHTERVAATRRVVPQEVTIVTLLLCLAWAGFIGFACGVSRNPQRVSWYGFATLTTLVVFVSLDMDRPGRGFVRPIRGHSIMVDLANQLAAKEGQ